MLAESGLLNGKTCSTHWLFANEFRSRYPEVELLDNKIVTDQTGLYTSGGATSYWNLLLYLIEKYTNRQMAVLTRAQRLNWLDAVVPEDELLRPMPVRSFRVRWEAGRTGGARVLGGSREFAALTGAETDLLRG